MPFRDDGPSQAVGETIAGELDMHVGRRTYEIFGPKRGGTSDVFATLPTVTGRMVRKERIR